MEAVRRGRRLGDEGGGGRYAPERVLSDIRVSEKVWRGGARPQDKRV